jgi:hypothetical protein
MANKKKYKKKNKTMEKKTKVQTTQQQQLDVMIKMIWAVCAYSVFLAAAVLMTPNAAPVRKVAVTPTPTVVFKSVQDSARVVYTAETWESEFTIEDEVTTSFTVSNLSDKPQNLRVTREIPSEEILVDYPEGTLKERQLEHITIPYLEYDISLTDDESKTIEVKSIYSIVPPAGSFDLPIIDIIDIDTGNKVTSSRSYEKIVIGCKIDDVCDTSIRENNLNCPLDCPSGKEDDLCDMKEDDKCDPDCLTDLDSDCKEGGGITKIPSVPKAEPLPETLEELEQKIISSGLTDEQAQQARGKFEQYQNRESTVTESEIRKINSDFLESKTELFQSVPKQPTVKSTSKSSFNVMDLIATEVLADDENPDEIDMENAGIPFDPDAKPGNFCEGGTPQGECATIQPWYCTDQLESVEDCLTCGCSDSSYYGKYCQPDGTCENTPYGYCDDGTVIGECSEEEWPRYCNMDGELVADCTKCGCPDIPLWSCNEDTGICNGCENGVLDEGEECDTPNYDCENPDDTCYLCSCVSKNVPEDTTCEAEDSTENYTIESNDTRWSCNALTVTSDYGTNFLDYIVDDAIDCCVEWNGVIPQRHQQYCDWAHDLDPISGRDCLSRYIGIGLNDGYTSGSSMGNDILWMANAYVPEWCCNNQEAECEAFDGIPQTCSPDHFTEQPFNDYVLGLTCDDYDCNKHDLPALKSAALINSGTCVDWSYVTTSLLRKTGYFPANSEEGDAIFFVTSGSGSHMFNLVWMDKFGKWVVVNYGSIYYHPDSGFCNDIESCDLWWEGDNTGHDNSALCVDNWGAWTKDNVYGCN